MRRSFGRLTVTLGIVTLMVACASRTSPAPKLDQTLITGDQLQEARFNTVYDAVEALHGNWLQTRGTDSFKAPSQVQVYLDNTMLGGVETLRDIAPKTVVYVRYFDGISATGRWGIGHGAGVIYVSSHPMSADPCLCN
jgi:hypothetical protein